MLLHDRITRFWLRVNKHGPYPSKQACKVHPEIKNTRCWLWLGCVDNNGYGHLGRHLYVKDEALAHRIAWVFQYGKIPKYKNVLHKCDTPGCMRHLFLGTQKDNAIDKCNKQRQAKGIKHSIVIKCRLPSEHGELNPNAIFTNKQVIKIRKLYATGNYYQADLGKMFGTSYQNIGRIVRKQSFCFI